MGGRTGAVRLRAYAAVLAAVVTATACQGGDHDRPDASPAPVPAISAPSPQPPAQPEPPALPETLIASFAELRPTLDGAVGFAAVAVGKPGTVYTLGD